MTNNNSNNTSQLNSTPLTAVEVFSGAGGLGLGLRAAGFNVVAAIEKVSSCVQTYRLNHPETVVLEKDARSVSDAEIKAIVLAQTGQSSVDLVAGGPPCETFSTAGPGIRNRPQDHREHLFRELIRIAKILNAKYVLIENVPGLKTKKDEFGRKSGIFLELVQALRESGFYRYRDIILNAADFGTPQYRNRLFIIATCDPDLPLSFPVPTHGSQRPLKPVRVQEALSDLPLLESDESKNFYLTEPQNEYQRIMRSITPLLAATRSSFTSSELTLHKAPKHRPGTIERFSMIKPGEGLKELMTRLDKAELSQLQQRKVLPNSWYIQRNRRILLDEPSPTVTSHCVSELLHATQNRHITPREAARLQGFPDWYFFEGPWIVPHISPIQDKYEQIGDAVPPLLALALGRVLAAGLGHKQTNRSSATQPEEFEQLAFAVFADSY